jgi:hypothetical protein
MRKPSPVPNAGASIHGEEILFQLWNPHPAESNYVVKCGVSLAQRGPGGKSRIAAGVLGILLGLLGIHVLPGLYEGRPHHAPRVRLRLLIKVGLFVMGLIGLIEGIIYLLKSDEEFYATYVQGKKKWF